jgi:hypothetical protein
MDQGLFQTLLHLWVASGPSAAVMNTPAVDASGRIVLRILKMGYYSVGARVLK